MFKKLEAMPNPNPEFEENPGVYRCYDCGNTKGFFTEYNAWTYEYSTICTTCGSENTDQDGEGSPVCECGKVCWSCDKCEKFCCQECWTWKSWEGKEEPLDSICKECDVVDNCP